MKIQGEHYEAFRVMVEAGIQALDAQGLTLDAYLARDSHIPNIEQAKDLEMRYRWDCLWVGRRAIGQDGQFPGDYQDSHIDTALKRIVADYRAKPAKQAEKLTPEQYLEHHIVAGLVDELGRSGFKPLWVQPGWGLSVEKGTRMVAASQMDEDQVVAAVFNLPGEKVSIWFAQPDMGHSHQFAVNLERGKGHELIRDYAGKDWERDGGNQAFAEAVERVIESARVYAGVEETEQRGVSR